MTLEGRGEYALKLPSLEAVQWVICFGLALICIKHKTLNYLRPILLLGLQDYQFEGIKYNVMFKKEVHSFIFSYFNLRKIYKKPSVDLNFELTA